MPLDVLSSMKIPSILTVISLMEVCYSYPHFTDEETEVLKRTKKPAQGHSASRRENTALHCQCAGSWAPLPTQFRISGGQAQESAFATSSPSPLVHKEVPRTTGS